MQLDEFGLSGAAPKKKKKRGFKKILKPLAHIGAAFFTGGASLAVSASMLKAKGDRKTAVAMQEREITMQREAGAALQPTPQATEYQRATFAAFQPTTQAFVSPPERVVQLAPSADSVSRMLPQPTYIREQSNGGGRRREVVAPPGLPAWAIPAAAAGAVALLFLSRGKS